MSVAPKASIVLTGCGWVTPLAAGTIAQVFSAARRGDRPPTTPGGYWPVPDEWGDARDDLPKEIRADKGAWMTAVALLHACQEASLDAHFASPERVGLVLGCGLAGQAGMIGFAGEVRKQSARFVSPIHFPQTVGNYVAGAMARGFNIRGPNLTLASGPASGLDAILEARAMLAAGDADLVFTGGVETLTEPLARGLADPDVHFSEGACLFILERAASAAARGRPVLGVIQGGDRSPINRLRPPTPGDVLLSCAGCGWAGAVFVEHWVGRCGGAAGAAALAGAIGATDGGPVPLLGPDRPGQCAVAPIPLDRFADTDGAVRAAVQACADNAHATTIELTIPRRVAARLASPGTLR